MLEISTILMVLVLTDGQCKDQRKSNKDDVYVGKLEDEFTWYDGRPMPPELTEMVANHSKSNDHLEDCMQDFSECMAIHKFYRLCAMEMVENYTKWFPNLCEFEYRTCLEGEESWQIVPESECSHLIVEEADAEQPDDYKSNSTNETKVENMVVPNSFGNNNNNTKVEMEATKATNVNKEVTVKTEEPKDNIATTTTEKPREKESEGNQKTAETANETKPADPLLPNKSETMVKVNDDNVTQKDNTKLRISLKASTPLETVVKLRSDEKILTNVGTTASLITDRIQTSEKQDNIKKYIAAAVQRSIHTPGIKLSSEKKTELVNLLARIKEVLV